MAKSYGAQSNPGLFVPTTYIWDVARVNDVDVNTPEFKELLVRLYQNLNSMAIALNWKDTGFYLQEEFVNGQIYFPSPTLSSTTAQSPTNRQVFRKVVNFGVLPNTAAKSVAHGLTITSGYSFTRIYGTATNPSTQFIPLPYASTTGDTIELSVDATNVTVTTVSNKSAFTTTYIVLEYIKQ